MYTLPPLMLQCMAAEEPAILVAATYAKKTLTRRLQRRNERRVNGGRAAFSFRWAVGTCRKSLFAEFSLCKSRRPTRSCRIHSRDHGVCTVFNSHTNMHCRSLTHLTRRHVFYNNRCDVGSPIGFVNARLKHGCCNEYCFVTQHV